MKLHIGTIMLVGNFSQKILSYLCELRDLFVFQYGRFPCGEVRRGGQTNGHSHHMYRLAVIIYWKFLHVPEKLRCNATNNEIENQYLKSSK